MSTPLRKTSVKLVAVTLGAGLALAGVVAIQAPAGAGAASALGSATGATASARCSIAKSGYAAAVKNATAAQKAATKITKRAKKARAVNSRNKAVGKRYTATKRHKKLIAALTSALKSSKATSLRTATTCGPNTDATRITKTTARITANTKKLKAATSKLTRSVIQYSPRWGESIRTGKTTTTVLKNGFVYKTWPIKVWSCGSVYWAHTNSDGSTSRSSWLNCGWYKSLGSNDTVVYRCFDSKSGTDIVFRESKGWTTTSAKKAAPKYCGK